MKSVCGLSWGWGEPATQGRMGILYNIEGGYNFAVQWLGLTTVVDRHNILSVEPERV